ncbi:MAG: Mut7-C RNAse domain-containing protein [Candidatus Bathyarchaeota archaeon]|nr:Mut7-C RNAse domain-containing protein [Candidatus Bathyarchaeota archaeon]
MGHRFLIDGMLGSLTRWLRIAGYDSEYRRGTEDDLLMEEARRTNRVLLTRDRVLAARAKKHGAEVVLIEAESDKEQLAEVASKLGLALTTSSSRCSKCNGELKIALKEEVKDKVPKASFDAFHEFWVCLSCGSVFWMGSHWAQIEATINEASKAGKTPSFYKK